jgi:hypothetical protein
MDPEKGREHILSAGRCREELLSGSGWKREKGTAGSRRLAPGKIFLAAFSPRGPLLDAGTYGSGPGHSGAALILVAGSGNGEAVLGRL